MIDQQGAPDPGPLSRLILDAQAAGPTWDQLADRAIDPLTGERLISRGYLYKVAKQTNVRVPTPAELRGIALVVRFPLTYVKREAAKQFLEFTATELADYSESMRYIVSHLEGMPEADVRRWRAMMEADEQARRDRPN